MKEYLKVAKKKKVKIEVGEEAIKKQLSYMKRNLESIGKLILVLTDFVVNQFLGVFDHSSNWQLANCAASCDGIEIH